MRRILALLLLAFSLATAPAAAQTAIHRCVGAAGNPVFTDQPCAALHATPLARPAQPASASAEPTPAVLCATSRDALQRAVSAAFANRDANRLAGLMLWGGYGQHAAVADIRALQRVMRAPLLDIGPAAESAGAPPSPAVADSAGSEPLVAGTAAAPVAIAPAPDNTLVLRMGAGDGSGQPGEMRFTVVRRFGCLWLRSAD